MKAGWWIVLGVLLVMLLAGGGVAIMGMESVIAKIASAIANAEGWNVVGSRPRRNHNPGNITLDNIGKGVGKDGMYIVFANDDDGWQALRKQVRLMFGGSRIYSATMTIAEMAVKYTATEQQAWAQNVARSLGVTTATKLNEISA